MELNYTDQARRPSVQQIVGAWRRGGMPDHIVVEYGETYAEFRRLRPSSRWTDSGNGCRGVDRTAVVKALEEACK